MYTALKAQNSTTSGIASDKPLNEIRVPEIVNNRIGLNTEKGCFVTLQITNQSHRVENISPSKAITRRV